jgi:hypothetical protein
MRLKSFSRFNAFSTRQAKLVEALAEAERLLPAATAGNDRLGPRSSDQFAATPRSIR